MNVYQEFIQCQENFLYFLKKYVKLMTSKGLIEFELYSFQKKLIEIFDTERFISVIKIRNCGIATITIIYAIWKCMFFPEEKFVFCARTVAEAKYLSNLVDRIILCMPEWLQPKTAILQTAQKYEIKIITVNSLMVFISPKGLKSEKDITHLIFDEAAFIPHMDEVWQTGFTNLRTRGKAIVLSTVNTIDGDGYWFYELWQQSSFYLYRIDYKDHPIYTEEYCKQTREVLGEKGWQQEVLGNFLATENDPEIEDLSNKELISFLYDIRRRKLSKKERDMLDEVIFRMSYLNAHLNGKNPRSLIYKP